MKDTSRMIPVLLLHRGKVDQQNSNWLKYYKIKLKQTIIINLRKISITYQCRIWFMIWKRFRMHLKDSSLRWWLGLNFALNGREVIQLRGYPNNSLSSQDGGTIYNKFSLELRYPITLNQSASIYALSFLEAGAAFDTFKEYNPFKLQRSAGLVFVYLCLHLDY